MIVPGTGAHLTFCLNVYPAGSIGDLADAVFRRAVRVRDLLEREEGTHGPFGIGLWIPAALVKEFSRPDLLDEFRRKLIDSGLYVFTLNGFPYGRFHGTRVKENVYRPDWSSPDRLAYTVTLARILANLLPGGMQGSISTVPVTFRAWAEAGTVRRAVTGLMDAVRALHELGETRGACVGLALEPEPGCLLETAQDAVSLFEGVIRENGIPYLCRERGCSLSRAEEMVRTHLGICLDTVHAAVMFEDAGASVGMLASCGIYVFKLHLGAAIALDVPPADPRCTLGRFADDVYLHQTVVKQAGGTRAFLDLPEALRERPEGEWRVHYHVPMAGRPIHGISTTSASVGPALFRTALESGVRQFEVETYTLSVMPGFDGDIERAMAGELAHVLSMM